MDIQSQEDDIVCRNAQVTKYASFGVAMLTVIALGMQQYLVIPVSDFISTCILILCILLFANSFLGERHWSAKTSAIILQAAIPGIVAALAWNSGGLNAPVMLILITMPVLAAMTMGSHSIIPSLLGVLGVVVFYTTLGVFNIALPESFLPPEKSALLRTNAMLMIAGIMGIASHFYELSRQRYQYIAETDGLTNVRNRRAFESYLSLEWRRQQRNETPISLIMLDIDDFKGYNDRHGHLAGDDCLRAVANIVNHFTRRAAEECFRYGGEEFAVILGNTALTDAIKTAEKIRETVESMSGKHNAGFVQPVTVSAGVATRIPEHNTDPNTLVSDADEQLYQSKQQGRNRVSSQQSADVLTLAVGSG